LAHITTTFVTTKAQIPSQSFCDGESLRAVIRLSGRDNIAALVETRLASATDQDRVSKELAVRD